MIPKYLSAIWVATAPALGNHLWQSTLFAAAAGFLTLFLRKHHARSRYWLWLAASAKFLVPFSLLVEIGSRLAWFRNSPVAANPGLHFMMVEIGQPFTKAVAANPATTPAVASSSPLHLLSALVIIWLCGFFVVVFVWSVRWQRISAEIRAALPLSEGREVGTLRRVERKGRLRKPIALLLSRASLEPGIFGIAEPVLIWPEGISQHLEDPHLEAILAHEVWHVRRRDNLFAAMHMLVEALFWFHPLVWWLGERLLEERERACDEEVVEFGANRHVYAESILKVCEFCLGSPLPCVAGVTSADLKQRMAHIMSDRKLHQLNFTRKLLLSTAAFLALAVPITFGLLNATPSSARQAGTTPQTTATFETVSIRPSKSAPDGPTGLMFSLDDGSFNATRISLQTLVKVAYRVQDSQLSGGPDWFNTERYDINAKMSGAVAEEFRERDLEQRNPADQPLLQALLRDHFKLALHPETRNLPVYDLVVDNNGPKFHESKGQAMMRLGKGELTSQGVPLTLLVDQLSLRLGRTVVDKTGLKGNYAFTLHWKPDASEDTQIKADGLNQAAVTPSPELAGSIETALQEQLGLKLEPQTETVQVRSC